MAKNPNFIPDPINGRTFEKHLHLFDTEKVVHTKDDVKPLKKLLSRFGKNKITGKDRESFSTGFKKFLQNADQTFHEVTISEKKIL